MSKNKAKELVKLLVKGLGLTVGNLGPGEFDKLCAIVSAKEKLAVRARKFTEAFYGEPHTDVRWVSAQMEAFVTKRPVVVYAYAC